MKRLIIYDLDGTLVDTSEDLTHSANHMRSQFGLPPLSREAVIRLVGRGVERLVAGCLETGDAPTLARGLTMYRSHYGQHLLDHSRLYPGVEPLLAHFQDRRQAVLTNKPEAFSCTILAGLGVADHFLEIIGGDSGYPKKPDPASLKTLLARYGVLPSEAVFIGDSAVDVQTGRCVGVETVTIRQGFADEAELATAAADVQVANFAELLEIAKQRQW